MTMKYKGSCLCGSISFEVDGFETQAANCHCTMCRKFHGSAYGTLVPVTGLAWLTGSDRLKDYVGDNGTIRSFCSDCGSSMGFRSKGATIADIEIAIATFDDDIPLQVDAQIYTNYKANWVQLQHDLPIHQEGREQE